MTITVKLYGYLSLKVPQYDEIEGIDITIEGAMKVENRIAMLNLDKGECIAVADSGVHLLIVSK